MLIRVGIHCAWSHHVDKSGNTCFIAQNGVLKSSLMGDACYCMCFTHVPVPCIPLHSLAFLCIPLHSLNAMDSQRPCHCVHDKLDLGQSTL